MTSDERLLQRYASARAETAFNEIVQRHYSFVYSVCRRQLGDDVMAQDATQAVFLLLVNRANGLRYGTVLKGWLFQTARLTCKNALRMQMRRKQYEQRAMAEMEVVVESPEETWSAIEPELDDALERLKQPDRDALLLRYVDEMSLHEVAVAMHTTDAAAHKRISRALDKLRQTLRPSGAISATALAVLMQEHSAGAYALANGASLAQAMVGAEPGARAVGMAMGTVRHLRFVRLGTFGAAAGGCAAVAFLVLAAHTATHPAASSAMPSAGQILTGRVVTAAGVPVSGASVTVVGYFGDSAYQPAVLHTVTTDSKGNYTTSTGNVTPYSWEVIADTGSQMGFGQPGSDTALLPSASLRLELLDDQGKPLTHVAIEPTGFSRNTSAGIVSIPLQAGCPSRLIVRSDDAGMATLAGIPQGWQVMLASPDQSYVPLEGDDAIGPPLGGLPQPLTMLRAGSISGKVQYPDGAPASNVFVEAQRVGDGRSLRTVTDTSGQYTLEGAPPGEYNIAADESSAVLDGNWTADACETHVRGGISATGQNINLQSGQWIEGTLRSASGAPASGVQVGVYGPAHPDSTPWVEAAWPDPEGKFKLRVPLGRNYVYVMTSDEAGRGVYVDVQDAGPAKVSLQLAPDTNQ